MIKYNKDEIKENLSIEEVMEIVDELGGEPIKKDNFFISKTICHNLPHQGSYKLYYYDNTKLFRCYTDCGDTFDIFELICRVKNLENRDNTWNLQKAIVYVCSYFGIQEIEDNFEDLIKLSDWDYFRSKDFELEKDNEKKDIELKEYNCPALKVFPSVHILPWEKEGISYEICKENGILFNPITSGVIIPHYDINNRLIGLRERTLIKDLEKNGKYKPAIINGVMYNHPLGFNLYNLNNSKDNIKKSKQVIVFEGEKSCLLYQSYFGKENDISVATCGSNITLHQIELLLSLGVIEVIIAFDRQFKKAWDEEWKKWTNKLQKINDRYGKEVHFGFVFDQYNELNYKDSPIDQGKELFLKMVKERIHLN